MKKLRIDAIAFILIITVLLVANLLNPNKPTVSALENRNLKTKPEFSLQALFSGDYFRDYEDYFSDTFIKRDNMVLASRDIKDVMSVFEPGVELIVTHETVETGSPETTPAPVATEKPTPEPTPTTIPYTNPPDSSPVPSPTSEPEPSPTATPEPTEPPKEFGDDDAVGYYLIVDGKAVQVFKFNREAIDYYTDVLNMYEEELGDDVTVYSLIAPTAGEFVRLRRYGDIMDSQNDAMDYLWGRLNEGIVTVNAYDELNRHKDEYIFFRTDHHWTALGAYYGYSAFAEQAGFDPVPLDTYETLTIENYLGSTYRKTLNEDLKDNPDTIQVYLPYTEYEHIMYYTYSYREADVIDMSYDAPDKKKYNVFLSNGGGVWASIKTGVNNGKKILVMKDSFGNSFIPFLLPHYEEIYYVDARFYNKDVTGLSIPEFIEEYDIDEMLFLFYMEDVNWTDFMNNVERHLN